jgi:hypothetical protein
MDSLCISINLTALSASSDKAAPEVGPRYRFYCCYIRFIENELHRPHLQVLFYARLPIYNHFRDSGVQMTKI